MEISANYLHGPTDSELEEDSSDDARRRQASLAVSMALLYVESPMDSAVIRTGT